MGAPLGGRRRPVGGDRLAATACVLGDLDLVAPLAMTGIRCSIVAPPGHPARFSRRVKTVGWADSRTDPASLLDLLLTYGATEPERPVLYYENDQDTLFVSRHRDELSAAFKILIPEQELVEDLLDKRRFSLLAQRLDLPVPPSQLLEPVTQAPDAVELCFPLVVKPSSRSDDRWVDLEPARKAIGVDSPADLAKLWPALTAFGSSVLLQQLVAGPETNIESHHAYVDADGHLVAEFTGKKLRTKPAQFGRSTALAVTDADDVKALGRHIITTLGLRGVAKLDFKRDAGGALWLLEVNPRYTLWHHPAARAGVNIPALVWADLTGRPRPKVGPVTEGVTWCSPWDAQAARAQGVSLPEWLAWAARCDARSMMDWSDPLPFLRLSAQRATRLVRRTAGHSVRPLR